MLHGRLLNYLDEVARTGSVRKTAERLNVSASAISRQIAALEEALDTQLFDRSRRRLTLTAAGEILIGHVRETLKGMNRAEAGPKRERYSDVCQVPPSLPFRPQHRKPPIFRPHSLSRQPIILLSETIKQIITSQMVLMPLGSKYYH